MKLVYYLALIIKGLLECNWPKSALKIDLEVKLDSTGESLWNSTIKLPTDSKCEFQGKIVKGFGRGSRLLMMPTGKYEHIK